MKTYEALSTGPKHDELLRLVMEDNPEARGQCYYCNVSWSLKVMPSLICPKCGGRHATEENYTEGIKYRLKIRAEKEAAAVAAEVAAVKRDAPKPTPPRLDDVIGNGDAVMQIRTALDGFRFDQAKPGAPKWTPFPHLLLAGPGGLGKTFLAEIVARELKRKLHLQLGQTLATPAKVAEVVLSLRPGEILFIDEIHQLPSRSQEAFYRAMEDGILIPVTRTGQPASAPVKVAPFTLIGATTDEWGLLPSMVQRFKLRVRLVRMTPAEIAAALTKRAEQAGLKIAPEAVMMIAARSLGTPRLAITLLDNCQRTAKAQGGEEITPDIVTMTCTIWQIDSLGLDRTARQYLGFLAAAGGGPVKVNVLAAKLDGLSRLTVERKVEPDLVLLGLMEKQVAGRVLTQAGQEHLAKEGKP